VLGLFEDGSVLEKIRLQDDYLDALISALVARAVELRLTYRPETEAERGRAVVEWIHVPRDAVGLLASSAFPAKHGTGR
jgi:hypothetical protein